MPAPLNCGQASPVRQAARLLRLFCSSTRRPAAPPRRLRRPFFFSSLPGTFTLELELVCVWMLWWEFCPQWLPRASAYSLREISAELVTVPGGNGRPGGQRAHMIYTASGMGRDSARPCGRPVPADPQLTRFDQGAAIRQRITDPRVGAYPIARRRRAAGPLFPEKWTERTRVRPYSEGAAASGHRSHRARGWSWQPISETATVSRL